MEGSLLKSPKIHLFWRRISSAIVDLLAFQLLIIILIVISGNPIFGILSSILLFSIIWFFLQVKYSVSIGKLLLNITTDYPFKKRERTMSLLIRYSITWCFWFVWILLFVVHPDWTDILFPVYVVWWLLILLSYFFNNGSKGIHDIISHTMVRVNKNYKLSAGRKVFVGIIYLIVLVNTVLPYFYSIDTEDGEISYVYDPNQLFDHYQPRVFEVSVRWERSGGFLWLETIRENQSGSAFMFVNSDKYALFITNRHVVLPTSVGAREYQCLLRRSPDEEYVHGTLIAIAKQNIDLALILVPLPEGWVSYKSSTARLSEIRVGEKSIAIGNTLGLGISISDGVISKIEKDSFPVYIRTSTPVSPGNSGGPLFLQDKGRWAGVITSGRRDGQNVNFAIPAEYAWNYNTWDFIIENGDLISEVRKMLK